MGLDIVGGLAIHIVLSKLNPNEAASVACVSRRFQTWVYDDDLIWAKFCADDLDLHSPIDHLGKPLPTFKVAYSKWREAFSMYPWSLVTRVKKLWSRLKSWLAANFPEVLSTLCVGVSEDEIASLERCLKVKLPLPTRVLYRFCNGQELPDNDHRDLVGLMGGYSFYNHLTNVYLLPLHEVVSTTKAMIQQFGLGSKSKYIVVASSYTITEKNFFLNCTSGQLYVGTQNLTSHEMLPCVPDSLISSVHDCKGCQPQDALLLWLEEHSRRLTDRIIRVRKVGPSRGINLFHELPPLCSLAVTNGVKVRASSVFVPEFTNLQRDTEKFLFAYSIRMSLLPMGCDADGMNLNFCQLFSRHWAIRQEETVVDEVDGVAVIGKHPILRCGKEEFVYESCSFLASLPGSIDGFFSFIPGSLADPKGRPFQVEVARFPLELPDYIF